MATAFKKKDVGTTDVVVFDFNDKANCSGFFVGCHPDSLNDILVRVSGLHNVGEYFPIYRGGGTEFVNEVDGISSVHVKGDGGAALVDGGVTQLLSND